MAANVETMFYVREKPWHGLGTMVAEALTSAAALRLAGLDWMVVQEPVYTGYNEMVKGYKANVRSSDRKVLGVVSDRYKVVQNVMRSVSPMNCWGRVSVMRPPGHCRRGRRSGCSQDFRGNISSPGSGSAPIWYFPIPMTVPAL